MSCLLHRQGHAKIVPSRCLAAMAEARGGWPKYVTDMIASTDLDDITEHGLFYRSGCLSAAT